MKAPEQEDPGRPVALPDRTPLRAAATRGEGSARFWTSTKTLLCKELRELGPLVPLVPLAALVEVIVHGPGERWIAPSAKGQITTLLVPALCAALIGCQQIQREARAGTLAYLLHREVGAFRAIVLKAAAGALVVLAIALGAPIAGYVAMRSTSPMAAVLQPARLLEMLCLAPIALVAHGAGLIAGSLRAPRWVLFTAALAGAACALWAAREAQEIDVVPPAWELGLLVLACALAWTACAASAAAQAAGLDARERAPRGVPAALRGAGALALCVPAGWAIAGFLTWALALSSREEVYFVPTASGGARVADRLDRPPIDYPVDPRAIAALARPGARLEEETGGFGARWSHLDGRLFPRHGSEASSWLDRDDGVVRVFVPPATPGADARELRLAPAGRRLERETVLVPSAGSTRDPLLLEPEARTLWAVRAGEAEPRLESIDLPRGERLQGWEIALDDDFGVYGPRTLILRGAEGAWTWRGDGLEPIGFGVIPAGELLARGQPRVLITDPDPLEPRFEVVDPRAGVLLVHEDRPTGIGGATAALFAKVMSLASSPLASLAAHRGEPAERWGEPLLVSPLVAGGRRPGLVALHAAISLALALWVLRRGAGSPRAIPWSVAVAALGPFAALAAVLAEPPAHPRAGSAPRPGATPELVSP